MARVLSTVLFLALVQLSSGEARAEDFGGASATSLGLAGAQVGSREDPAAALANPAALGESRLLVGAVVHFGLEPTSAAHPGVRVAYSRALGERLRLGLGVTPRSPIGCYFACGTRTPGSATELNYEATLALDYLALDEPEGQRLAIALGYRPHFSFGEGRIPSASGGTFGYSGSAFGPLGFVFGVIYSPFDELSFGVTLESGSERGEVVAGDSRLVGALPPRAALGAELDVDRFLVRAEYGLVGTSIFPALAIEEAGSRVALGATENIIHEFRLGGAERFSLGRSELALRLGLSIRSNPGVTDRFVSSHLPVAAPIGGVSLGAAFRTRESEWSFAASYRSSLGASTYAASLGASDSRFSELVFALDASFDLSR